MDAYSNPSKFQKDSIYVMRYDILKIMVFLLYTFSIQGQHLNTAVENVWKTMIFKMSYLMTYKCYSFEIWRGYCRHPYLKII